MMTLDEITKKVLEQIDASGFKQSGAFNLRHNGIALCHGDSEHIKIKKKQDKPGIDIYIDGKTDGEEVHIPVVVDATGMTDVVYNDFYIGEGADVVVVAFGAAVFLYTQGWGYPTQETVVKELFANPEAASSTVFAKEVDADKAKTMVEPLVADANPAIDGVDKSMSDSTVYVTAKTEQGGDVQYKVSLVRDMIGWKVSSVELYFPSQN